MAESIQYIYSFGVAYLCTYAKKSCFMAPLTTAPQNKISDDISHKMKSFNIIIPESICVFFFSLPLVCSVRVKLLKQ